MDNALKELNEGRQGRDEIVASSRYPTHERGRDRLRNSRRRRSSSGSHGQNIIYDRDPIWRMRRRSSSPARRSSKDRLSRRRRKQGSSQSPIRRKQTREGRGHNERDRKKLERRYDYGSEATTGPSTDWHNERAPLASQRSAFQVSQSDDGALTTVEKQRPNYEASGKLAAETNTVSGTDIVLKYNEPPEARKDSRPWKLFIFKGQEMLDQLELYRRSCWLFGRETTVVDYVLSHPSCSKQHAVLQFRHLEKRNEYGDRIGGVKPYIIDLDSANGTKVNDQQIPERRFVELKSGDVLTFGESSRDYVMMLPS